MTVKIAPSILAADFANLGSEIKRICNAGADFIHIDVMDGNFVPNLTIGPCIIEAIKSYSDIPFDVHLMIENPEKSIDSYVEAGADIITFHLEATKNPQKLIEHIKSQGKKVGISLMPKTSAENIFPFLEILDLILIMTVEPGFGGQQFMENQLVKISQIKEKIDKLTNPILLSVDGGINQQTSRIAIEYGANMLVSGSWIFKQKNIKDAITQLRG